MIKDLEIKDCTKLLSDNYIGHLAFIFRGSPYVIPITYYYDHENNSIISYSGPGHKINAMRTNDSVALEVDEIIALNSWKSVLVQGTFEELKGIDAKHLLREFVQGVKKTIIQKENKEAEFIEDFSSKIPSETTPVVYRIKVEEITGKLRDI